MAEAGRLADLQAEYRSKGLDMTVVLAPWQNEQGEQPSHDEILEVAEFVTDTEDGDRSFPVFSIALEELESALDYSGQDHPGRCVIGPDRTIEWCASGHGADQDMRAYLDGLL